MLSAAPSALPIVLRLPSLRAALLVALFMGLMLSVIVAPIARAQTSPTAAMPPPPPPATVVITDSPRETLATFLRLRREMEAAILTYQDENSFAASAQISYLTDQLMSLIDLSEVTATSRREVGMRTVNALLDIFGRIPAPDATALPNADAAASDDETAFRIPGTPLRIVEIHGGPRHAEFLFSASTVQIAPRFLHSLEHLPLDTRLEITSYTDFGPQLTGPLIPAWMVRAIPAELTRLWLGTPAWKVLLTLALLAGVVLLLVRLQHALVGHLPGTRLKALLVLAILPLAVVFAVTWALPLLIEQVHVSGDFADALEITQTVAKYVAYAALFWLAMRILFELIITSPRIPDEGLDANLLRLLSGIFGIIGVSVILAFGGQAIGLPIISVLTGLGIGGLAVALALRPTLENFVGGVMLYFDRPVRVGDLCTFGSFTGTVERIGLRSIRVRSIDRTVIAVPNAQFADMQIINWTKCDQMLIMETIAVRIETTPDQLRLLLAGIRHMCHAHPRVIKDTLRVRLIGYGPGALNIGLRIYIDTNDFMDFFAVREDIFLRIHDIVAASGTAFARPAQTLFLARDSRPDPDHAARAEETVAGWRAAGNLPFPGFPPEELASIADSLDYPPHGSPGGKAPGGSFDAFLAARTAPAAASAPPAPPETGRRS